MIEILVPLLKLIAIYVGIAVVIVLIQELSRIVLKGRSLL